MSTGKRPLLAPVALQGGHLNFIHLNSAQSARPRHRLTAHRGGRQGAKFCHRRLLDADLGKDEVPKRHVDQ